MFLEKKIEHSFLLYRQGFGEWKGFGFEKIKNDRPENNEN
jgi:hypothetical protein